jgi:hypothetical protein
VQRLGPPGNKASHAHLGSEDHDSTAAPTDSGTQTSEWVISPSQAPDSETAVNDEVERDRSIGELRGRIDQLERAVLTLRDRTSTAERRAGQAERTARAAAETKRELRRQVEDAGQESERVSERIQRPRIPRFPEIAAKVEQRVSQAEQRVGDATRTITQLAGEAHRPGGRPNVNEVAFDELRELGLTITESAHLLAIRDVRGGFRALNELDDLRHLSEERRTELKRLLSI